MSDESEQHVLAAEYHLQCARGADPDPHPGRYALPTAHELRELRETCGLSREDVSDRIDYTEPYLTKIEQGHAAPGRELLQKLLILYRHEWPKETGDRR